MSRVRGGGRVRRAVLAVALVAGAACGSSWLAPAPARADAVLDAKRKAAGDLMRDGKVQDAIAMYQEVMKADPSNYKDVLQLARAYDKLGRTEEALDYYRRVLETPGASDDRVAKTEVERRLKVLDAQTAKIQAAEDEFLKKLDALEREAVSAKDMRALERVFALRGGVWNARGRKEGFGVGLAATAEWQDSGAVVRKNVRYRVRAAGFWNINGKGQCTADGLASHPPTPIGTYGMLIAQVEGGGYLKIGTDTTFTAPATGRISFTTNVPSKVERDNSTGRLYILVTPLD